MTAAILKKFIFHNKLFSLLCSCRFSPRWVKNFSLQLFRSPGILFRLFLVGEYWKILLRSFQGFSGVFSAFWYFVQTFSSARFFCFGPSSSPKLLVPLRLYGQFNIQGQSLATTTKPAF